LRAQKKDYRAEKTMCDDATTKTIVDSFMYTYGHVSHHTESYANYVTNQIPPMLLDNKVHVFCPRQGVCHDVHLTDVTISKPVIQEADGSMRPLSIGEARTRRQTLLADVCADVHHDVFKVDPADNKKYVLTQRNILHNVLIMKVPAMVGSVVCNHHDEPVEAPGTFIINGYHKTIISQERAKCNFPYVLNIKKVCRFSMRCEIRSDHTDKIRSTSTLQIYVTGKKTDVVPTVSVVVPFVKTNIPLPVCFYLLGVRENADMANMVLRGECSDALCFLAKSVLYTEECTDQTPEKLMDAIGVRGSTEKVKQRRIQYVDHIFSKEVLPHCGPDRRHKAEFMAFAVRKLLRTYLGEIAPDDIDNVRNKRVQTAGTLLAVLTRQLVRQFFKTVHIQIFRAVASGKHISMTDIFSHRRISMGLKYAMSTGNWGVRKGLTNQTGVCQVVSSVNTISRISHGRQINTPLNRDGKVAEPRQLHTSKWGLYGAAETPEGRGTGLLNTFAAMARVRVGSHARHTVRILCEDLGVTADGRCTVFVNCTIAGFTNDPATLVAQYRAYRRWHSVPIDSSVHWKDDQVHIYVDGEGMYRPLFNLSQMFKLPTMMSMYGHYPRLLWHRLLIEGVIEYIDKCEESGLVVNVGDEAPLPTATHAELHPSLVMLGLAASCIPYSNRNQAPRNIYASSMMKQAIGSISVDNDECLDAKIFNLNYPQRPVVSTWLADAIGVSEEGAGQACVVAIMCLRGYNQEDSVILNRAALERGLFRTSMWRHTRDCESTHGADVERFEMGDEGVKGLRVADYSALGVDAMAEVTRKVSGASVLVRKTISFRDGNGARSVRDRSYVGEFDEPARVERVLLSESKDGLKSATVRTVGQRQPEVGDKFASRCGQKGVVGAIFSAEDMPWTAEGIQPDIIINPHAIPSRMTISQLLESLVGKLGCMQGKLQDGTPHRAKSIDEYEAELKKEGFMGSGNEVMYSGTTGLPMTGSVFIGVTQYQRLRHMVADKIHARSTGKRQILTRQPVDGRSRRGGFRMGEMERDSLIGHGATNVILDRFMMQSDPCKVWLCTTCRRMSEPPAPADVAENILHRTAFCRVCTTNEGQVQVTIPYATKLLIHELNATHIDVQLDVE
jgi:DNA-directed RNA polymerase II subunit RPB2